MLLYMHSHFRLRLNCLLMACEGSEIVTIGLFRNYKHCYEGKVTLNYHINYVKTGVSAEVERLRIISHDLSSNTDKVKLNNR